MKRILNIDEIEEFEKIGIFLYSDRRINWIFSISIKEERMDSFKFFLDKFLLDIFHVPLLPSRQCLSYKENDNFTFKVGDISVPFPKEKVESITISDVNYTKLTYIFENSNPLVVAKIITDLSDCVNFINKIWGYDNQGDEILLIKYPIGTIVNVRSGGRSSDKDFIIKDWSYDRDRKEILYVVYPYNLDLNMTVSFLLKESQIKPSRGNNLNILLNLN